MITAITGAPGTGKTTVANILSERGFAVYNLKNIAIQHGFIDGYDAERDSIIIDIDKLDNYISKMNQKMVLIEGHLSHLLKNISYTIILRCHPRELRKRLEKKDWNEKKILENLQAEVLDVILVETVEIHPSDTIFEIDTTNLKPRQVADIIAGIIDNGFILEDRYKIGRIDWSEELLRDEDLWKE